MSVKWWLSNTEKTKMVVKKMTAKYEETTLNNIINNWAVKEDSKLVKLTDGRSNVIEFYIYSSLPFLTYNKKIDKDLVDLVVFEDMFAIRMVRIKLGESATEVVELVENLKCNKMAKFEFYEKENWLERDEMIRILNRLDEIMQYLPEYGVADTLCSYD